MPLAIGLSRPIHRVGGWFEYNPIRYYNSAVVASAIDCVAVSGMEKERKGLLAYSGPCSGYK
jgi:hypothetical protein